MREYLDFEKPIAEIEEKIEKLTATGQERPGVPDDLRKLREKLYKLQAEIYTGLTPWQRTQVARHPQRPSTLDYIGRICDRFLELHGDRLYGDDHAIVAGLARLSGRSVVVIGPQKGKTLKERVLRNFGMPNPEGYRKALRLMRLAERFNKPVITFIDTPGAYPGLGAEERGQSEAIARNLMVMASLKVPIVSVVIGSILPEPPGGAHRDPTAMCNAVKKAVEPHLSALLELPLDELLRRRHTKYRRMGVLGGE